MPLQPLMHNALETPQLHSPGKPFFPWSATVPAPVSQAAEILYVKELSAAAAVPTRIYEESADVYLAIAVDTCVPENGKMLIPTELAVAVTQGTYARIAQRS